MTKSYSFIVALLCAGAVTSSLTSRFAAGQDLPMPSEALPPTVEEAEELYPTQIAPAYDAPYEQTIVMDQTAVLGGTGPGCDTPGQFDFWNVMPATTESTGSWLRRGFWYTEVDGLAYQRAWDRDDTYLARDTGSARVMSVSATHPALEGNVRATLGRFLFRDIHNRDHSVQFTVLGGGEWVHTCSLASLNPNGIAHSIVNVFGQVISIDGNNPSFDGSSTEQVTYGSRMNSFEVNYRVGERLKRDRMELMPNGRWVRRATPGLNKTFLTGLRFIDISEQLDWTATGITDATLARTDESGSYNIRAGNRLFGAQGGVVLTYESDRWSLGFHGKAAALLNETEFRSAYTVTNSTGTDFTAGGNEGIVSFLTEAGIIGKWHLRPNLSFRVGYDLIFLSSVAVAPKQINFVPDYSKVSTGADIFMHGSTFGLECYW